MQRVYFRSNDSKKITFWTFCLKGFSFLESEQYHQDNYISHSLRTYLLQAHLGPSILQKLSLGWMTFDVLHNKDLVIRVTRVLPHSYKNGRIENLVYNFGSMLWTCVWATQQLTIKMTGGSERKNVGVVTIKGFLEAKTHRDNFYIVEELNLFNLPLTLLYSSSTRFSALLDKIKTIFLFFLLRFFN